jgi:hypothetical protein
MPTMMKITCKDCGFFFSNIEPLRCYLMIARHLDHAHGQTMITQITNYARAVVSFDAEISE